MGFWKGLWARLTHQPQFNLTVVEFKSVPKLPIYTPGGVTVRVGKASKPIAKKPAAKKPAVKPAVKKAAKATKATKKTVKKTVKKTAKKVA